MARKKAQRFRRPETSSQLVKYVFSDKERLGLADEMAKASAELEAAEQHRKAAAAQLKADVDAAQATLRSLSEKVRSGYEYRDVDCHVDVIPDENKVVFVRVDNGETASSRAMTEQDRQRELGEEVRS